VTISNGVTSIGNWAFWECSSLISIEVGEQNPVYSSMDGVLLNKGKTVIILYPAGKTGSYTIPDSVTSIGDGAFSGCTSLTSITIPDSVTSIGSGAFSGCSSLTSVYFQGRPPSLGASVFHEANRVRVYYLPGQTGWGSTFGGRPTALWIPVMPNLPSVTTDNPLRLRSSSPAPAAVRVQRSANLVDWEDWQTVSKVSGPSELQDTEAGSTPYRF